MGIAARSTLRLRGDASRVVTKLFIPGQELVGGSESRTSETVARVLALSDDDVNDALDDVVERFSKRHEDLTKVFDEHADRVDAFVSEPLSSKRRQLLGAAFTHEYSIEGASVCNPSLVADPNQADVSNGGLRVIMSYRAIGEGHRSTLAFRTGLVDASGMMTLDEPQLFPVTGRTSQTRLRRDVFQAKLRDLHLNGETGASVLQSLGSTFTREDLDQVLLKLSSQSDTRQNVDAIIQLFSSTSERFYEATFDEGTELSRRVLWPTTSCESVGIEDARFVEIGQEEVSRFVATYTAYDGRNVTQQLLQTNDFRSFTSSPLSGRGANNKGLAIFPRRIDGDFVALSRHDRESNAVAFSTNLYTWDRVTTVQSPVKSWEMLQMGNCGSPIEVPEGWLVITHGVGPMRTYGIGALLLDLHDPTKVLAELPRPLLVADFDEQDGYVPNVVYSCGSLLHAGTLYLPYGIGDQSISYCTVDISDLMAAFV